MKELLIRTLTGISLILIIAGAIIAGPVALLIVLMILFLAGIKELLGLYSIKFTGSIAGIVINGLILLVTTYLVYYQQIKTLWFAVSGLLFITVLVPGFFSKDSGIKQLRNYHLLVFVWLAIPLSSFLSLGCINQSGSYQYQLPLAVITLIWVNDTFAYITGILLGKHKMAPSLSPGKSWEGFLGGLLFTLLAGWMVFWLTTQYSLIVWLMISILTSVTGLSGDLFESRLKRQFHVKDAGSVLPGHGGVLDRFDSLLFAAPAVLMFLGIIQLFL